MNINAILEDRIAVGILSGIAGSAIGAFVMHKVDGVAKAKIEASYPPEYWTAQSVTVRAEVDKHRITTESQERLTIDSRNRLAEKEKAIREFEKDAPPEYWACKKVEEEEKSRRHQMDLDDARRKQQIRLEQEAVKHTTDAIDRHIRSLGN